ncbi:mitochondrial fission ELM1 family protein [Litoribacillus peritrichatus]|uniref:ELM1/GtrOC1 family putative glycosyltransferase n=1 Tax=Litoribacillus peritrichatus TaxID=718191 RepID=A0ABP7MMV8_9GAMM
MTLRICFITDNKPGHKNQLEGLQNSLALKVELECVWLSVKTTPFSWLNLFKKNKQLNLPFVPDVVIAAGSDTQLFALTVKRQFNAFLVLLMRPSVFPQCLFDALIIPEHDKPKRSVRIFKSFGVLNKVRPHKLTEPSRKGLILIGGESKHYHWNSEAVLNQISTVIEKASNIDTWLLTDSRRTPEAFRALLGSKDGQKIEFFPHESTDANWLPAQMKAVDQIWVTPDSVSMVYEALSSGKITGLFVLSEIKQGRVVQGINNLMKGKLVLSVSDMDIELEHTHSFCEADRAADWLLSRLNEVRVG